MEKKRCWGAGMASQVNEYFCCVVPRSVSNDKSFFKTRGYLKTARGENRVVDAHHRSCLLLFIISYDGCRLLGVLRVTKRKTNKDDAVTSSYDIAISYCFALIRTVPETKGCWEHLSGRWCAHDAFRQFIIAVNKYSVYNICALHVG